MNIFNQQLLDLILLNSGLAYSQYVALRGGVFSLGAVGFACLGAYTAAILTTQHNWGLWGAVAAATLVALVAALILIVPLARLRGVYQAIATVAFVQVVGSAMLYAEPYTRGAMGINNIPHLVTTWHLIGVLMVLLYVLWMLDRTRVGYAFDAIRQDETVAVSLGISIVSYHALAFGLSGAIGGMFGGLHALYMYSIEPGMFGFPLLVAALTFVVFGGRNSFIGPLVGAAVLTTLPEISRPLADWRMFVYGALLILATIFMPLGIADSVILWVKRWHLSRQTQARAREVAT
jgi:branched-chain amino acid transport system permease protein